MNPQESPSAVAAATQAVPSATQTEQIRVMHGWLRKNASFPGQKVDIVFDPNTAIVSIRSQGQEIFKTSPTINPALPFPIRPGNSTLFSDMTLTNDMGCVAEVGFTSKTKIILITAAFAMVLLVVLLFFVGMIGERGYLALLIAVPLIPYVRKNIAMKLPKETIAYISYFADLIRSKNGIAALG